MPRRFGRYALFDFIGKGGMAEIFLARATTELGAARLCVVKQIVPEYAKHPQFAEMLIHEAKLAARLNHAHIVQVFDLGRADEQLYIAMEYVEGFDLNALLRRCSQAKVPLPFEFALGILSDVLKGLDYAHRRMDDAGKPLGIVHRDVSPSNILISLEGEVKLCDFGIAHANDLVQQTGTLVDEAIKGKAGYMSPEHARGEPIDARADVFAAGIVLWELLAGKRMYRKEPNGPSLLEVARRAEIPELPKKDLPYEEKLHAIVKKALAANREERFPAAAAMLRELSSYMSDAKLVASPLKLGEWLVDHFGSDRAEQRKQRERLTPVPPSASAASSGAGSQAHSQPPRIAASAAGAVSSGSVSAAPRTPGAPVSSIPPASTPAPKIEVAVKEPDPPSLAAATVDVVPSSDLRQRRAAAPKPRATWRVAALAAVVILLALVGAILAMR